MSRKSGKSIKIWLDQEESRKVLGFFEKAKKQGK